MTSVRVGFGVAIAGIALLVVVVAGIVPWVVGVDADCDDRGPHSFFLLAWPAAAFLGVTGAVIVGTSRAVIGRGRRLAGVALGLAVPVSALVWFVVVVADGIRECGF